MTQPRLTHLTDEKVKEAFKEIVASYNNGIQRGLLVPTVKQLYTKPTVKEKLKYKIYDILDWIKEKVNSL